MLDHFGGRQRAETSGIFMAGIAHQTEQESGGEQIAGAGGVDELRIGNAGTAMTPSFEATMQPFSLRVTTPSLVSWRNCFSAVSKSEV